MVSKSTQFHVGKLEKVEKENKNLKTKVTWLQNALNKATDQVNKLVNDLKSTNSNLDDLKYNSDIHNIPEEDDEKTKDNPASFKVCS